MRITGGEKRGFKLKAPRGDSVRPAPDMVRLALFNILGPKVEGARVLDLFAGSGSLGMEALSRGAAQAVFVDASGLAMKFIRDTLRYTGLEGRGSPVRMRAADFVRAGGSGPFDIVFMDPPFVRARELQSGNEIYDLALSLAQGALVSPDGRVIIRYPEGASVAEVWPGFEVLSRRRYGASGVIILKHETQRDR
jgi:16S rRNA (guanine966-N2)-methyltransferase